MTRKKAGVVLSIAGATLVLGAWAAPRLLQADSGMRVDLTIYLGGTLTTDGGVIMILPTAVPPDEFVVPSDLPNPAHDLVVASDADQIILGADVFAQKSIVTFYYPEGVPYNYRFRTRDPAIDWSRIRTGRIGVGSGNGIHPVTGEVEPYDTIFTHHFDVGSWTMAQSREASVRLQLGFLTERYVCENFAAVQVCDASFDRLKR